MENLSLNILNHLPQPLLTTPAEKLHEVLPGPTLIHLPGERPEPVFISVLLHGNETTGWIALQRVLNEYQGQQLPRAVSIFIGNIAAAAQSKRVLPYQLDYNRAWRDGALPEQKVMQEVIREMREKKVYVSVDIHNNTGHNPHYACVNKCSDQFLHLAKLFSSTVVYFIKPDTVQSMAFSKLCPAITVECGQPGHPFGTEHASQLIRSVFNLESIPNQKVDESDINLYHTMATVKIPERFSFSFHNKHSDIIFRENIDQLNFTPLHEGEYWAEITNVKAYLDIIDENGNSLYERYFSVENKQLISHIHLMPSMLTTSEEIVRQDCLCYIMEKVKVDDFRE